jgi:hypothetical protein
LAVLADRSGGDDPDGELIVNELKHSVWELRRTLSQYHEPFYLDDQSNDPALQARIWSDTRGNVDLRLDMELRKARKRRDILAAAARLRAAVESLRAQFT